MERNPLEQGEAERFAHLDWPFFGEQHRSLVGDAARWASGALGEWTHAPDADASAVGWCARWVQPAG